MLRGQNKTATNSTYNKLAFRWTSEQWLNEALLICVCFFKAFVSPTGLCFVSIPIAIGSSGRLFSASIAMDIGTPTFHIPTVGKHVKQDYGHYL